MAKYDRSKVDPALREVLRITAGMPVSRLTTTGVSGSCIRAWRAGRTRNPQNVTLDYVLKAAGFERVLMPIPGKQARVVRLETYRRRA